MNDLGTLQTNDKFLSSRDAARMYRVTNDYIARLARRGKLQGKLVERTWMIEEESLKSFFAHKQAVVPVSPPSKLLYVADEEVYAPSRAQIIPYLAEAKPRHSAKTKILIVASVFALLFVVAFASPVGALLHVPHSELTAAAGNTESPFLFSFSKLFSAFASIFHPTTVAVDETPITQAPPLNQVPTQPTPIQPPSIPVAVAKLAPQPVVQNITNPVVERTVERITSGVSQEYVAQRFSELENTIKQQVFNGINVTPPTYAGGGPTNNLALSQIIDRLDGVTITNSTINGYLPTSGGTINGNLTITGSCTGCGGGGSGDLTIDTNGNIYTGTIGALSDLTGTNNTIALGRNAGVGAISAVRANFFGYQAGQSATAASYANFFGPDAGGEATNANDSNFIGSSAGNGATNADNANFFGQSTGQDATNANNSNFFGQAAGIGATNADHSNFFGSGAGDGAANAPFANFIGYQAGKNAVNAKDSIFVGLNAGVDDTVNNTLGGTSIAIGNYSGTGGFSNSIALGHGVVNSAAQQLNIGNVLYATGIYNSDTQSAAPTSGNIGVGTSSPLSKLTAYGDLFLEGDSRYINFATITGSGGYGFRDNSGNLEFKNSGGSWAAFGSGSSSGAFPFTPSTFGISASNATSTLIGFTNGIYALASSTIGGGSTTTGLTISGGATTTGSLIVLGSIKQRPPAAASISNYLQTNAAQTAATVNLNPGLLLYSDPNNTFGIDLGYNIGRYRTRIFTSADKDIAFSTVLGGASPTTQSDFTDLMVIRGTGIVGLGNVGIGTTTPYAKLSVHAKPGDTNLTLFAIGSSTQSATSTFFSVSNTGVTTVGDTSGTGDATLQLAATADAWTLGYFATDKSFRISSSTGLTSGVAFSISKGGKIGIGTTTPVSTLSVQGSLCVRDTGSCGTTDGTIYATTASITDIDLAENYMVTDDSLTAGEIVALDETTSSTVRRAKVGDTPFGVISTAPGLLLGQGIKHSKPIALKGRVPLKVSLENGPIAVGDSVTLSSLAGIGAKATSTSYRVGIALEPYTTMSTSSVIDVFIEGGLYVASNTLSNIDALAASSSVLSASQKNFVDGFFANIFSRVATWLASTGNGIADIFAAHLHADVVYAKSVHTDELCVGTVCVTEQQFLNIVGSSHSSPAAPPVTPPANDPPATTTPPETPPQVTPAPETPPADIPAAPQE